MQNLSREVVFAYGAAAGVIGALVVILVCITIADRVHRWRVRRRIRNRSYR